MANEVHAFHILVPTEQKALELKSSIEKDGEKFARVAKRNSTCPSSAKGGELGWFSKGQMVPEFETAAFGAEVGKVVGPIKTQFGYHLILVDEVR